jgi:hypothetical protein
MGFDFLPFWPSLAGLSECHNRRPRIVAVCQNVPSMARVAAVDFGFLTLIQVFDGPDR